MSLSRVLCAAAVATSIGAYARPASAGGGVPFSEGARAAGMADAVVATPGTPATLAWNPAGLADVTQPVLELGTQYASVDLWWQRPGETRNDAGREVWGFNAALAARLPGPAWLRTFRVGAAAYVPGAHALRFTAPERRDIPTFPLYGDRLERAALSLGLASQPLPGLNLGVAFNLAPAFSAPNEVRYDASRSSDPNRNVVVDIGRDLELGATAAFGLRWQALPVLAFGAAYRQEVAIRAFGPNDTRAGGLVVADSIDFVDYEAPNELALGVAVRPFTHATLSLDVTWAEWSRFRTIHNRAPDPAFRDVWDVRAGAEARVVRGFYARAGYGFEPSPAYAPRGADNVLDLGRHVLAAGVGVDFREIDDRGLRLDLAGRMHLLPDRDAQKSATSLPDIDPDAPGKQIDDLGYPGLAWGGQVWQVAITATFYVGDRGKKLRNGGGW